MTTDDLSKQTNEQHGTVNKAINDLIREYKSGHIDINVVIKEIHCIFRPLYISLKKKIFKNLCMDLSPLGNFQDVYLETIHESIAKFDFNLHNEIHGGQNKLSFVPFFHQRLIWRYNDFLKEMEEQQKENAIKVPIMTAPNEETGEQEVVESMLSKDVNDGHFDDLNLEATLKTLLTQTEYKILYLHIKGRSYEYIGSALERSISREMVRRHLCTISEKIKAHFEPKDNT